MQGLGPRPFEVVLLVPNMGLQLQHITQVVCAIDRMRLDTHDVGVCVIGPAFIANQTRQLVMSQCQDYRSLPTKWAQMGLFTRGVMKILPLVPSTQPSCRTVLLQLLFSTMKASSQRPKEREADLDAAIEALDLARTSTILPAKAVFGSVTILLTTIRVRFLFFRDDLFQVHTQPGLNDRRTGLCRARAILCQYLSNA